MASAPSGGALEIATRRRMTVVLIGSNIAGGLVVWVFLTYVLPTQHGFAPAIVNDIAFVIYLSVSLLAGYRWSTRDADDLRHWMDESDLRPPTPRERMIALRTPSRLTAMHAWFWGGAVVVFSIINATVSGQAGWTIALTLGLAGTMTTTVAYLLSEQMMRPTIQLVLAHEPLQEPELPGVRARLLLAWALGTGAPLIGIVLVGAQALHSHDFSRDRLAATVGFLAIAAFLVGMGALYIAARSIAEPLAGLRRALERVRRGDVNVSVAVDDSSEVGLLQAGFNNMVDGLRERERLQDLFGRHVGEDVARQALEGGVKLGGELREAAVLFIDIAGSTSLPDQHSPEEVVELLNRFFKVVVETTGDHSGWVNKFEGDAALCIFGAPLPLEDAAGCALAAGRAIRARLVREVPELAAGIGLSAGTVVAGNVGAAQRYEYTVIGAPVNEAARLTELAKTRKGGLVASEAIVERADPDEAAYWRLDESVHLRGMAKATRLAVPSLG
jgi:adenylate cyclase